MHSFEFLCNIAYSLLKVLCIICLGLKWPSYFQGLICVIIQQFNSRVHLIEIFEWGIFQIIHKRPAKQMLNPELPDTLQTQPVWRGLAKNFVPSPVGTTRKQMYQTKASQVSSKTKCFCTSPKKNMIDHLTNRIR